jgi:hypothetical protein
MKSVTNTMPLWATSSFFSTFSNLNIADLLKEGLCERELLLCLEIVCTNK